MQLSRAPQPVIAMVAPSDAALTDALVAVAASLLKAWRCPLASLHAAADAPRTAEVPCERAPDAEVRRPGRGARARRAAAPRHGAPASVPRSSISRQAALARRRANAGIARVRQAHRRGWRPAGRRARSGARVGCATGAPRQHVSPTLARAQPDARRAAPPPDAGAARTGGGDEAPGGRSAQRRVRCHPLWLARVRKRTSLALGETMPSSALHTAFPLRISARLTR